LLRSYTPGKPEDWYFHRPLWLQAPCAGHTLWAYNLDHLNYVGKYIQADLREKQKDGSGWTSMLNRLPRWMKAANNRDAIRTAIEKLRQSLMDDK